MIRADSAAGSEVSTIKDGESSHREPIDLFSSLPLRSLPLLLQRLPLRSGGGSTTGDQLPEPISRLPETEAASEVSHSRSWRRISWLLASIAVARAEAMISASAS